MKGTLRKNEEGKDCDEGDDKDAEDAEDSKDSEDDPGVTEACRFAPHAERSTQRTSPAMIGARWTMVWYSSRRMKLFLDTANVGQVGEVASWGVLDGVTTNPSLVAKEGKDFKKTVLEMCAHVPCVSAQVTATDFDGMKKQGEEYASWHKHVYVKVPMTTEGLKALKHFRSKGIRTNTTLVFSVPQAILAAKAGANIISPFIGRLDDAGEDGMALIGEIMQVWSYYEFDCEVLVASTRHPRHIAESAKLGAHICTVPYDVFAKLPKHPLTDIGLKKFQEDWEKVKQ
jgi:transaldolase